VPCPLVGPLRQHHGCCCFSLLLLAAGAGIAGVGDEELLFWAENYLCPNLNPFDGRRLPNSILVLDNATVHHSRAFIAMVEETG
jgi:hypothetical protein